MTHPAAHTPLSWRPDIDGLRAVAVLSVVVFHAFPNVLPGGFVGVDVFFVISGYLIGRIIFQDLQAASFSFGDFYVRRIRRIFPALLTMMAVTCAVGYGVLLTDEFRQLGKHMAGGAGFVANLVFLSEAGYFDRAAETKPLLHLWSLGVEEQFYLLWPVLAVAAWKLPVKTLHLLVGLLVLSLLCAVLPGLPQWMGAFFSPVGRFWELWAGALLAHGAVFHPQWSRRFSPRAWDGISVLGAALLVFALAVIDKNRQFPGFWAALPVAGAVCLLAAGPSAWVNRHVLSRHHLVVIGLISYPLYLWHWPVLYFVRLLTPPNPAVLLVAVGGSLMLAWGTYAVVERPLRFGGHSTGKALLLAMLMVVCGAGGWQINQGGQGGQLARQYPLVGAAHNDMAVTGQLAGRVVAGANLRGVDGVGAAVLFYGDSHVDQYMARFVDRYGRNPRYGRTILEYSASGCPPIPHIVRPNYPSCLASGDEVQRVIADPSVTAVVLGGAWNKYFIDFTTRATPGDPEDDYYYQTDRGQVFWGQGGAELALAELARFIRQIAAVKPVTLMLDNPHGDELDVSQHLDRLAVLRGQQDSRWTQAHNLTGAELALRQRLKDLAGAAGAKVVDPVDWLCTDGQCPVIMDRRPIYVDTHHLSASYVKANADYIDTLVAP